MVMDYSIMFTQFHVQSLHTSTTANCLATNRDILLFTGTNDEDKGGEEKEERKEKTHFDGGNYFVRKNL